MVSKRKGKPAQGMDVINSKDPAQVQRRLRRGTLDPEIGRQLLGGKPLEDWDLDELARGRPRASDGTFKGRPPAWLTPQMKEEANNRFREYIRGELAGGSLRALARIKDLVDDAESDRVRLDASKFLIEYLVGKPTQEIKADVGIQIQSLLAGVLVNPGEEDMGILEAEVIDEDDEEDDDLELEDD